MKSMTSIGKTIWKIKISGTTLCRSLLFLTSFNQFKKISDFNQVWELRIQLNYQQMYIRWTWFIDNILLWWSQGSNYRKSLCQRIKSYLAIIQRWLTSMSLILADQKTDDDDDDEIQSSLNFECDSRTTSDHKPKGTWACDGACTNYLKYRLTNIDCWRVFWIQRFLANFV